MSNNTKNIMIVGVGGQGSLLASKLLGRLLLTKGYDVKVSEVHGMSQRGGSVVTYVRFGDEVFSPVIDEGEADFIVSFELLEAARWTKYLKNDGRIITNTQKMKPMPVVTGMAEYPAELVEKMKAEAGKYELQFERWYDHYNHFYRIDAIKRIPTKTGGEDTLVIV